MQDELARNRDEGAKVNMWALEIEALRKAIEQAEKIDQEIAEELTRLSIDANAAPRVMLYRAAEVP